MWSQHPDIARRWTAEYGSGIHPSGDSKMKPMMNAHNAIAHARAERKGSAKKVVKAKLGSGARFAALKAKIAARGNVTNPAAVAAAIGRKKYGNAKMAKMSAAGRRK